MQKILTFESLSKIQNKFSGLKFMIVVTGGTGLVGSHLLYELTSKGEKVRALKRESSNLQHVRKIFSYYNDHPDKQFSLIEWVTADVLDASSLYEAFEGATIVYHTAAFVSFDPRYKKQVYLTNITGTANVVNVCLEKKVGKLCHVSSVAAIGNASDGLQAIEDMIWTPSKNRSNYSISKFHSEMEVWRGIEEGLQAIIVNPSVILGPGNWESGSSALFSTIYKGMKFYPSGMTGYVDVRDVAKTMIQLVEQNVTGERFILNAGNRSFKEIFQNIASGLNRPKPTLKAKKWMGEIAWRIIAIWSFLVSKSPKITRETISAGFKNTTYSSEKIVKTLNYTFIDVERSLQDFSRLFLLDKSNKVL